MVDLRTCRLLPVLALALAASCSTSAEFEGRDEAGILPTGRLTFDFSGPVEEDDDPVSLGRGPHWLLEVEGTNATGDIGRSEYDVTELTIGGRLRWQRRETSQIDFLIGAASTDAELEAGNAGGTAFDESNVGPYIGVEARYADRSDALAVYGRLQNAWLLSDATSLRAEIGTEISLFGPVDLLVGYRWWRYVFDEDDIFSSDSDAELLLRGVVVGLHVGL